MYTKSFLNNKKKIKIKNNRESDDIEYDGTDPGGGFLATESEVQRFAEYCRIFFIQFITFFSSNFILQN